MLSLARRPGQKIRLGADVVLVVREIRGRTVKLGIEAPEHVRVLREEIYEELVATNQRAIKSVAPAPPVVEAAIVTFVDGLPGFVSKRWLCHPDGEREWFIAVDQPEAALLTVDPRTLWPHYAPPPEPSALASLGAEPATPLDWRVIVGAQNNTANLFAPVLVHRALRRAAQMPLVGSRFGLDEPWTP